LHGVENPPVQEQYDHVCHELLSNLQSGAQSSVDKEDREDLDEHFLDGITLGKYAHAVHHSDGIFSTVYKARPVPPRGASAGPKYVALKVTVPEVMSPPHDSVREARILTETASPHVISLLETFRLPGGEFIMVFPFMPLDLEQLLKGKRLTTPQLKSHLTDLFRALEHLHTIGIIHRDIKPSNILLASESGPACLADFGIAWSPNDNASEPPLCKITDVGTTSYRPPELLFGFAGYSSALDMWAAGCVVAEVVTLKNKPLFNAGPLGSELTLISSIFKNLGTPNLEGWPVRFLKTHQLGSTISYKRITGGSSISRLGED
jgi:serine/threonine protein kinase